VGKTVETYIVDKKKRMITDSRFIKNAILKIQVETPGTDACFSKKAAPVLYKNYQGGLVLGTQQYLPDQQWCILTEIDVREAFQPASAFRTQIIFLLIILAFFIVFFVKSAGKKFIAPITMLRDAALKVARGSYDVQVANSSQDEIGELSVTFNQMTKILASTTTQLREKNKLLQAQKEELKKFDQLKSEFVSTVSHELRTPMTIIKESIAQLLEEENMPRPEKNLLLNMAINNINRLANLINNLLDLSKIEAGKVELHKQKFNLVNLIQEVCKGFELPARQKGIDIRWKASAEAIEVFADPDKLTQVFLNLVGNSMKFVQKGYIEISALSENNHIKCIVADTGPGIGKDDLQKVFNKFQQFGHQASGGVKGTGLGLSICKGLIDLHGGDIWVESEAGEGTRFIFTLPNGQ
jgi:signal transduction histidine kinase